MTTATADLDLAQREYRPSWEHIANPLPKGTRSIAAARKASGLDWEPVVEPVFDRRRIGGTDDDPLYEYFEPKAPANLDGSGKPKPLWKFVKRSDDGLYLDTANYGYKLFSNGEMFEVANDIAEAARALSRTVTWIYGGEVAGGKRTFLMGELGVREITGDPSPHVDYVGLVNSHDGSASLKFIGTDMRWWCTNVIKASELAARQAGTAFSFRHTGNLQIRVDNSKAAIVSAVLQLDSIAEVSEALLRRKTTRGQREKFIEQFALARVISKADINRAKEAEVSAARATALATTTLALNSILDSRTCEGIAGTAYGLYAAAVEFLDHRRPAKTPGGLFDRTVFNTERGKVLALDTVRLALRR